MNEQMNEPKLRFGDFQGGWSKLSIDELSINVIDGDRGTHYPNKEELLSEGSCLFLSAKNVTKSGFQFLEKQFITEEKDKLLRKGKLKRGDIVLTTRGSVGHKALYTETVEFDSLRINSGMVILRHQWEELSNNFIYKSMFTRYFTKQIDVVAFGSAQPALTVKEIKKLKLSLPPSFPEQQKIASFLSKVDEKIALLTEKKYKLTEYKKGVMQQLFDGKWQGQDGKLAFVPPTLRFKADDGSEFPDWETVTIEKVAKLGKGFTPSTHDPKNWNGGLPWLSIADLNQFNSTKLTSRTLSQEGADKKAIVKAGTLIMSFKLTLGRLIILQHDAYTNEAICHFNWVDGRVNTKFAFYYLSSINISSFGSQAAKGITLNNDSLYSIVLKLPFIDEQVQIANCLSAIDQKIELASSELEKVKEWKKGLLQQMFV